MYCFLAENRAICNINKLCLMVTVIINGLGRENLSVLLSRGQRIMCQVQHHRRQQSYVKVSLWIMILETYDIKWNNYLLFSYISESLVTPREWSNWFTSTSHHIAIIKFTDSERPCIKHPWNKMGLTNFTIPKIFILRYFRDAAKSYQSSIDP